MFSVNLSVLIDLDLFETYVSQRGNLSLNRVNMNKYLKQRSSFDAWKLINMDIPQWQYQWNTQK